MVIKKLKRSIAAVLTAAIVASSVVCPIGGVKTTKAYEHVKATAADRIEPNANNKKGVQGSEVLDWADANGESLSSLGINHIMFNVDLTTIIATDSSNGSPFEYKGTTYYFNDKSGSMLQVYKSRVKQIREAGGAVTFCLLLSDGKAYDSIPNINVDANQKALAKKLMYNYSGTATYYALNSCSSDPAVRQHVEAVLAYMAEQFSYSDTFVQFWRVGNEVNVSHDSNFSGAGKNGLALKDTIVNLAVNSYDTMYKILAEYNPNARVYVSVTHDWLYDVEGSAVPTREFLDAFAAKTTSTNWNVDFHAYPAQMHVQVWAKESAQYLSHDVDSKFVSSANLEVLTNYIKTKFGTNHRVMLGEQGFDSNVGEDEQAAMMAYTYYAAANNDMIDNVTFTTWNGSGSGGHDGYNMGIVNPNGSKKKAFNVYKYVNTSEKSTYVDPYLSKLSAWTGRTISAWTDDILYKAPATTATFKSASIYYPARNNDAQVIIALTTSPVNSLKAGGVDIEYKWTAYDTISGETTTVQGWTMNQECLYWTPKKNSTYNLTCDARIAGNPTSTVQKTKNGVIYKKAGVPDSQPSSTPSTPSTPSGGRVAPYYNITTNGGEWKNERYYLNGAMMHDCFFCDGTYTYYLETTGAPMKDRLTYHPDGVHVIYFDEKGHEVFSDFHQVKKAIAGNAVDDYCFFDVYGYMYVDVMTYDKTGKKLYYINPYGQIERKGWFKFSSTAVWAGTTKKVGTGWGYGQSDGSLMINKWTTNKAGKKVYMQGDGHMK